MCLKFRNQEQRLSFPFVCELIGYYVLALKRLKLKSQVLKSTPVQSLQVFQQHNFINEWINRKVVLEICNETFTKQR